MADFRGQDIEHWLKLENDNVLQKVCNVFDAEGLLVEQYKTRIRIVPAGTPQLIGTSAGKIFNTPTSAPALYRTFNYDDEGNQIASVPSIREWTQACEDAAVGAGPDPEDPIGVPFGMKIASSDCFKVEDNIASGIETSIGSHVVPITQIDYVRYVHVSSCNRGTYKLYIDGIHQMTRITTWTRFNETFDLSTANGGKALESGQNVEVKVINNGVAAEDFEAVFVVVQKPI